MGFFGTNGDVVDDIGVELTKGGDEEGGGGLTVYVEIAPDADALVFLEGVENDFDGFVHVGEFVGGGGGVVFGVEEGLDGGFVCEATTDKGLSDEGMATDQVIEGGRRGNGWLLNPFHS